MDMLLMVAQIVVEIFLIVFVSVAIRVTLDVSLGNDIVSKLMRIIHWMCSIPSSLVPLSFILIAMMIRRRTLKQTKLALTEVLSFVGPSMIKSVWKGDEMYRDEFQYN